MNLLFIIPGFFNIEEYQKRLYNNNIPLGTLQISSFLKKKLNLKTDIIDMRLEEENNNQLEINNININKFNEFCLKIFESNNIQEYQNIGINCYTSYQYQQTLAIANLIKKEFPDKIIFVGGYHPSAVPGDFIFKNSPFDFIIKGEAEIVLYNLFKKNALNKTIKKKEPVVINPDELIDINNLPPPDYELFLSKYPFKDKFNFDLYMSRGCPYQCSFCSLNYPFRSYSFDNFQKYFNKITNIVSIYNKKNTKISFADQSFFNNPLSEHILEYIIENNLQEEYKFSCQSRIESLVNNDILLKKIQNSNMIVGFGFESANKELLIEMHKTESPSQYIKSMKLLLEKYKKITQIYCRINILCGFPGETKKKFTDTIDFINKYAIHENIQISPSIFSCYPNTPVYANIEYYEKKYNSKLIKNWWKLSSNNFKNSVFRKVSKNYSLKQLIWDYKENYTPILNKFRFKNYADLLLWKDFFNRWFKNLNEN